MSKTQPVPPFVNKTMELILRSPLHSVVSHTTLLITFTGRKSGKTYTTPVSYTQTGDLVSIFTHADWWKNLRCGEPITLHIQGRVRHGLPVLITSDQQAVAAGLAEHLRKVPRDARYCAVTFDDQGIPRVEEVEQAAATVVMIQIRLC